MIGSELVNWDLCTLDSLVLNNVKGKQNLNTMQIYIGNDSGASKPILNVKDVNDHLMVKSNVTNSFNDFNLKRVW